MMRSLFAAVSGLRNHQLSLSVIGNNIANINTVGFKTGRTVFQEMLSETIQGASRSSDGRAGTNPLQVGLGMSVASVSNNFGQGQLQLTGNQLDMAVQGDGFFVMEEGGRRFYGRAGAFGFDGEGRLTAGQGMLLQGWMANEIGEISSGSALDAIQLPFGQKAPAEATREIRLASNLDASAEALSTIMRTTSMRALAAPTDQIHTLFNSTGQDLGIQEGDVIRVSYAGTADTLLSDLSTVSGSPLDLIDGDVINVSDGLGSTTISYDSNWSLQDFANAVETALTTTIGTETDVSVVVNDDGTLGFLNPSGGNNTDLTVTLASAGRTVFNSLVASVPVINGTTTAKSQVMEVEKKFTNGQQFQNLNDLAAAIQSALQLGSPDATVSFVDGRFVYDNSGGNAQTLTNVVIDRPGASVAFGEAMGLSGASLNVGGTLQSDRLLDTADENDNLTDLYNLQGDSLGLALGDVFTFDGKVGGSAISQATLSVVATGDGSISDRDVQTLGGLMSEMEDVLNLTNAGGVTLEDGSMVVNGRSGLAAELSDLIFNEINNADLTASLAFTEVQAATDVTHEASIRVYDSLGNAHLLEMTFTKDNDTDNRWTWSVDVEDGEISAGGSGAVTFFGDGSLESFTTDDGSALRIDPTTGADGPMVIDFNAGSNGGIDGITGFARTSTTAIVEQDGYGMGTLESISLDGEGVITGVFTNGTSRALAQIGLATFKNASGLQKDGGNRWAESPNSGESVIRRPGTDSGVGTISAGTLEMSNVDIAQEFTNMIVAQRGFQANARTVTTSDEMLQELVNLKR